MIKTHTEHHTKNLISTKYVSLDIKPMQSSKKISECIENDVIEVCEDIVKGARDSIEACCHLISNNKYPAFCHWK